MTKNLRINDLFGDVMIAAHHGGDVEITVIDRENMGTVTLSLDQVKEMVEWLSAVAAEVERNAADSAEAMRQWLTQPLGWIQFDPCGIEPDES